MRIPEGAKEYFYPHEIGVATEVWYLLKDDTAVVHFENENYKEEIFVVGFQDRYHEVRRIPVQDGDTFVAEYHEQRRRFCGFPPPTQLDDWDSMEEDWEGMTQEEIPGTDDDQGWVSWCNEMDKDVQRGQEEFWK